MKKTIYPFLRLAIGRGSRPEQTTSKHNFLTPGKAMMKNSFAAALFIALLLSFKTEKSSAQITAVGIEFPTDMILPSNCVTPALDSFLVYGYVTGTVTPSDVVTLNLNFDDGFDTTVIVPLSGTAFYAPPILHHIHLPGTYSTLVTATATGGATATAASPAYVLSDSCSTLTGTMYMDLNGNCTQDAGEPGMSYMPVYLSPAPGDTTLAAWTDHDGHYAISVFPGSYVVITNKEAMGGNVNPTCPTSGTYSFTAAGGTYTKNFAYQCATPTSLDMSAQLYYENLNAGYNQVMAISVGDWYWFSHLTCTALSATVTLTLDPHLTYYYSFPGLPTPTVSGSTLTWHISTATNTLGLFDEILVHVSDSLTLGDTICNTLYVTPTALTDPDLANNTVAACTPVGAAYDPNGKSVSPLGTGPQGYIANNTPLSYFIHFQNTGTAPAASVTVIDTLDANLDAQTLHIMNATAPANIYTSGNVVTFRFDNINLPDSATSATASTGAIEYAIMPKGSLAPGTQIQNRAGIYFDYNPVVMTNTTLNTIDLVSTSVQHIAGKAWSVSAYPNPANGQLKIVSDNQDEFTVSMTDILGRTVQENESTNGAVILNTISVPGGLYLVRAVNRNGNELTAKVEVRH